MQLFPKGFKSTLYALLIMAVPIAVAIADPEWLLPVCGTVFVAGASALYGIKACRTRLERAIEHLAACQDRDQMLIPESVLSASQQRLLRVNVRRSCTAHVTLLRERQLFLGMLITPLVLVTLTAVFTLIIVYGD